LIILPKHDPLFPKRENSTITDKVNILIITNLYFWPDNGLYNIKRRSMKTILNLIETLISQLTNNDTRKMPALIPVRVVTKAHRDHL
jgi:hypothetical protein